MAKVKINKLPPGFKLVDGKIVQEEQPNMQMGGYVTGDQMNYGLVTVPSDVTNQQMSDSNDPDIRYSLSSVPREEANIEAEGGETALTDLNQDGNFGLYDIKGPRHSSGGVPMFLPDQSFIFSDTKVQPAWATSSATEDSTIALLRSGIGLAFIRNDEADTLLKKGEIVVWPGESFTLPLRMAYLESRKEDPVIKALLEIIVKKFEKHKK